MADQARRQAESVRRTEVDRLKTRQTSANGAVQWVDPRVFAQMGVEPADPAAAPSKKVSLDLPSPFGRGAGGEGGVEVGQCETRS